MISSSFNHVNRHAGKCHSQKSYLSLLVTNRVLYERELQKHRRHNIVLSFIHLARTINKIKVKKGSEKGLVPFEKASQSEAVTRESNLNQTSGTVFHSLKASKVFEPLCDFFNLHFD
jgi:hypothetical protein